MLPERGPVLISARRMLAFKPKLAVIPNEDRDLTMVTVLRVKRAAF